MSSIVEWLLVAGLAVAFNVTPVLAPPTIALLAYFHLNHGLEPFPLALVGAAGAAFGRVLLALLSRRFGGRLIPADRRANIDFAVHALQSRRSAVLAYLALFAVGPIPKGTLFIAVGLAGLPVLPPALVFGAARFTIYFVSLLAVDTAEASLGNIFGMSLTGSIGIAIQIVSIAALLLFFRYDWRGLFERHPRLGRYWQRIRRGRSDGRTG